MHKQELMIVDKLEKPVIPDNWDYDESVEKTIQIINKWKNITVEFLNELYIAREKLKKERGRGPLQGSKYRARLPETKGDD